MRRFNWGFNDFDNGPKLEYIINLYFNFKKQNQFQRLPLELISKIFKLKQKYEINELIEKIKTKKINRFIINEYYHFKRYIHSSDEWPFLFLVTYTDNSDLFPKVSHCQFKKVDKKNIGKVLNKLFENFS